MVVSNWLYILYRVVVVVFDGQLKGSDISRGLGLTKRRKVHPILVSGPARLGG